MSEHLCVRAAWTRVCASASVSVLLGGAGAGLDGGLADRACVLDRFCELGRVCVLDRVCVFGRGGGGGGAGAGFADRVCGGGASAAAVAPHGPPVRVGTYPLNPPPPSPTPSLPDAPFPAAARRLLHRICASFLVVLGV